MIVSGKMFLMCVNIHYELNASRVLLINSLTVHDSFALSREFSSCSAWQWMLSYVRYRFITACMQLNALFCCLWRNVEASCHKHFVIFSHNQHRRLLPAMCHNLRDGGRPASAGDHVDNTWHVAALTAGKARYRLRVTISAYPTCIRRLR